MTLAIDAARTNTSRRLLAGVISPILFLIISVNQMPFNPGFDLANHAFSYLSIGDTGLVQQVNFVVMGLLNVVAATALRSYVAGPLGAAAAILLAFDGLGQVIAGIFTLDPSNGFPSGAPAGMPETVSMHGHVHGVGFGFSLISWFVLLLLLARRHAKVGERAWSLVSIGGAVALLVTAACLMTSFGTVLLYIVLTNTWLFTAATLHQLRTEPRRQGPAPRGTTR